MYELLFGFNQVTTTISCLFVIALCLFTALYAMYVTFSKSSESPISHDLHTIDLDVLHVIATYTSSPTCTAKYWTTDLVFSKDPVEIGRELACIKALEEEIAYYNTYIDGEDIPW